MESNSTPRPSSCHNIGSMTRQTAEADVMDSRLVFVLFAFPVVTGLAGNIFLMTLVACNQRVKSKPLLFLMSIAAADLILSVVCGLYHIDKHYRFMHSNESIGHLLCQLTCYAELTVQIVLVFSLLAMSVERFVVICFPLHAKRIWTRARCRVVIVVVWVSAMLIGLVEPLTKKAVCFRTFISDDGDREVIDSQCSYKESGLRVTIAWTRLFLLFGVPFLAMLGFYGAVIYHLWHSTDSDLTASSRRHGGRYQRPEGSGGRRFARHASEIPMAAHRASSTLTSVSVAVGRRQMSETFFFQRQPQQQQPSLASFGRRYLSTTTSAISAASILSLASSVWSMVHHRPSQSDQSTSSGETTTATDGVSNVFVAPAVEFVARRQMAMEVKRSRKRVMKMLLLVLALFVLSWSPKLITELLIARRMRDSEDRDGIPLNFTLSDFANGSMPFDENAPYHDFHPGASSQHDGEPGAMGLLTDMKRLTAVDDTTQLDTAFMYAVSLMLFHSTFNPVLYIAFSSDFRSALCSRRRRLRT